MTFIDGRGSGVDIPHHNRRATMRNNFFLEIAGNTLGSHLCTVVKRRWTDNDHPMVKQQ